MGMLMLVHAFVILPPSEMCPRSWRGHISFGLKSGSVSQVTSWVRFLLRTRR